MGEEHLSVYQAWLDHPRRQTPGNAERRFCKHCGSALWVWGPGWPELLHPFASAIDTDLPPASARTHILLDSKPAWSGTELACFSKHRLA